MKPKFWSIKKADDMFSLYIRERDGKCLRCGKLRSDTNPLTCSHFWARQHNAVRFDPENCVSLCWIPCHKYHWEKEKKTYYRDFMVRWLGEEKYMQLEKRARSIKPQLDAIIECMQLVDIS